MNAHNIYFDHDVLRAYAYLQVEFHPHKQGENFKLSINQNY